MGQLIIPSLSKVYTDSSIFIYTVESNPNFFALLQPLWAKFQTGEIEIVSSELTLMETLVVPLRNSDTSLVTAYEQLLLTRGIQIMPITQSILKDAARLRATTNLKTPDALHAATAFAASCTMFLTNDRAFRNVSGLAVTVLSEVLAS